MHLPAHALTQHTNTHTCMHTCTHIHAIPFSYECTAFIQNHSRKLASIE